MPRPRLRDTQDWAQHKPGCHVQSTKSFWVSGTPLWQIRLEGQNTSNLSGSWVRKCVAAPPAILHLKKHPKDPYVFIFLGHESRAHWNSLNKENHVSINMIRTNLGASRDLLLMCRHFRRSAAQTPVVVTGNCMLQDTRFAGQPDIS